MIQGKNPQIKSAPKRSVREASRSDLAGATAGWPWFSPRPTGVNARSCVCPTPNLLRFLSWLFVFRCIFLIFAFKRGCIWLKKRTQYHLIPPLSFLNSPLVLERKGVEAKIVRIPGRVYDRKIQARVLAELAFASLLFSQLNIHVL